MRWTQLDKILKLTLKEISSTFINAKNDIIDTYYSLNLDFDEINNLGSRQKRMLDRLEVEKNSLLAFYKKNAKTNRDILFVLIYAIYEELTKEVYKKSVEVFEKASKDAISRLPFDTTLPNFMDFTLVLGIPYLEYLESLSVTNAQESYKSILTSMEMKQEPSLDKLVEKQRKRILNINEDKHSGVLHDISIQVENESYVAPLKQENHRVKFVAIEDERTTKMCNSLDGQIFNTIDRNSFDRETESGLEHFEVDGLQVGINLPPIQRFTHHCRSWVEYID